MPNTSRCYQNLYWLALSLLVIAVDQWTKAIAMQRLALFEIWPVMPGFNFTLKYNTGAAFSLLAQAGGWQQWLFGALAIGVSVVIVIWLTRISRQERWVAIALSLIMGGALGNLWDRLTLGYVVDFIEWYVKNWYWPAFNIADSAIVVGASMLIINMLFNKGDKK